MKINFGISIASQRQLSFLPDMCCAGMLELPVSLGGSGELSLPSAWKKRVVRINGRSETRTLSSLTSSGMRIRMDFFRMFAKRCEEFAACGAEEFTFGVDWESIFNDDGFTHDLREIIRCCFGILAKHGFNVLLELRIPGNAAVEPQKFLDFRDSLLYPVKTVIDIHPHEPGALELLGNIYAEMPFECNKFRISFDASGGNYLSAKLMEKIKSFIRPAGYEIPEIYFYPGRNAEKDAFEALLQVMM